MRFASLLLTLSVVSGCAAHLTNNPKTPAEQITRAAETGDIATVKKLLAQGVEPDGGGRYADGIEWANHYGHQEIVRMIEARCMEIYVPKKNCGSFPFWIAYRGDEKMLTTLLNTKRADANQADGSGVPMLVFGLANENPAVAKLLLARGADPDKSILFLEDATLRLEGIDHHSAAKAIEEYNRSLAIIKKLKAEGVGRIEAMTNDDEEEFSKALKAYQKSGGKMVLPEEARKFKVQAEDAVNDKNFEDAADLYGKALNLALWWPEGHFNRALVLGEGRFFAGAIREMKRYLALVPKAPDARAAQDKIYMWERKAGQ